MTPRVLKSFFAVIDNMMPKKKPKTKTTTKKTWSHQSCASQTKSEHCARSRDGRHEKLREAGYCVVVPRWFLAIVGQNAMRRLCKKS
jgi:hypothetical protein